jgi:hypothetical protein
MGPIGREQPRPARRRVTSAVSSLKKGKSKQQCKLAFRMAETAGNKAFGTVVRRVGNDVVR